MSIPIVNWINTFIVFLILLGLYCSSHRFVNLMLAGFISFNCFYCGLIFTIGLTP